MNLTVQSDYAFRTLMYLAVRDPQGSTIQEISEHYGISRGHLMVIVHRLGTLGFLETTRGRGGGIKLARAKSSIFLDEILLATEPGFDLVECYRGDANRCLITTPCRLRGVLDEALEAWMSVLRKYSLADLVEGNPALVHLMKLPGVDQVGRKPSRRTRVAGQALQMPSRITHRRRHEVDH
ncbi:Rrf2 family transcriptional regulator [uncultured Paludibaculum sp.]|uniref:RrF2 family transcriptional regulator n=1 Tax=uncultured Paludibaculum sp. TaxID=1765020 RepID=UPI002AAAAC76|nr:Rrf2 family transcriptional regulator [uncultured Paludibaculum sp.]